jgi:uncharacterized C2H2 Zn-finger protein
MQTVYCPRCDRSFSDKKSHLIAMDKLTAHVKKAHPEYTDDDWKDDA